MSKQQRGFTLIELIVVIVILGILAATALPRFVNLQGDARLASMQGLAGSIRAAADLVRGKWLAAGSTVAGTLNIGGTQTVLVSATGYPTAATGGIVQALNLSGNSYAFTAAGPTVASIFNGPVNCTLSYEDVNGAVDTTNLTLANCQ